MGFMLFIIYFMGFMFLSVVWLLCNVYYNVHVDCNIKFLWVEVLMRNIFLVYVVKLCGLCNCGLCVEPNVWIRNVIQMIIYVDDTNAITR